MLALTDAFVALRGFLEAIDPPLAERLPPQLRDAEVALPDRNLAIEATALAEDVALLALALPLLTAAALAGAVWAAPGGRAGRRRRAVVGVALAVAAAGIALVVLVGAGRLLVEGAAPDPATAEALGAAWGAFLAGLLGWGVALAALGVALTAAATLPVCRVAIDEQLRALAGLLTRTPEGHWAAIARGVALVLAGWALATRPLAVVELVVPIAGLYLVFAGLAELLHESGLRPAGAPRSRGAARLAWRVRAFSAPSATALLVLGAGGALVALFAAFSFGVFGGDGRGGPIPPEEIHACNGHASLCDRPLSEVAFAGSHNAMAASSEPGWLFASHRAGIATQLDHGERALLVDTHYGAASGGLVRTALS